jgi:hypothetical protein
MNLPWSPKNAKSKKIFAQHPDRFALENEPAQCRSMLDATLSVFQSPHTPCIQWQCHNWTIQSRSLLAVTPFSQTQSAKDHWNQIWQETILDYPQHFDFTKTARHLSRFTEQLTLVDCDFINERAQVAAKGHPIVTAIVPSPSPESSLTPNLLPSIAKDKELHFYSVPFTSETHIGIIWRGKSLKSIHAAIQKVINTTAPASGIAELLYFALGRSKGQSGIVWIKRS